MFQIFNHVRRVAAGTGVDRSRSVEARTPGTVVYDNELARLRQCWVESHRLFSAAPPSERDRVIHAVHASANAYFDYLDRTRVEDHVPAQSRPRAAAGIRSANARTALRLAPSQ